MEGQHPLPELFIPTVLFQSHINTLKQLFFSQPMYKEMEAWKCCETVPKSHSTKLEFVCLFFKV